MSQEIEIEFKNLLTREEYERLHAHLAFEPIEAQEQTNYYFETDDLQLKERGAALRIREKQAHWELTLKEPHPDGLLETTDTLSPKEAQDWIDNNFTTKKNVSRQLKNMGIEMNQLTHLGKLVTKRKERSYKDTTVVLDHSSYNGVTDHEFELEAPTKAYGEEIFENLLRENHITKKETPNKIRRFYDSLQNR